MTKPDIRRRRVARVILLNPENRVLLFDTWLAYTRAWIAPGGALEGGETFESAAARELEEETGIRGVQLSRCVWTVGFRFPYRGSVYDQIERYFVGRTSSDAIRVDLRTAVEATEIQDHRWWSLEEIVASSADFRPANIGLLLPAILSGHHPEPPRVAPVERSAVTV